MLTKTLSKGGRRWAGLAVLAASLAGCFAEPAPHDRVDGNAGGTGGSDAPGGTAMAGGDAPTSGTGGTAPAPVCLPARGEAIPPRVQVLSADAAPTEKLVFTSDVFSKFKAYCGACHVEAAAGGFNKQKVTLQNFALVVDQTALDRVHSNDETKVMPPLGSDVGKLWKDRAADDGVREFADLLEKWLAAGRPKDLFVDKPEERDGVSPYLLSEEVGMGMTNIGNCIPNAAGVATEADESEALDEMFAKATELPLRLQDTDLTTLDAAALSRMGVVAFAPAYPLWSDDAKKLRQIRLPRGTTVKFDKVKQTFEIPPNARFYKTFLKEVTDVDGNVRYKKIETRLIVSRPDECTKDDRGEHCVTPSLMGTYKWNDAETEATLVRDPRNDGTPFADVQFTYITNEAEAAKVENPEAAGLTRHYAIPGKERCVQCHMGSDSKSGILGFLPLQIARRPKGEGGVIDDTNEDELSQLQRFIDYGLITGMDSRDEVAKLEESQAHPPRNDYELVAQGYMLGNCAHCHNPRGYPSQKNPELEAALDLFPDMTGGIFQFPLERVSPRLHRGQDATTKIPYITPSLLDGKPSLHVLGQTTVYTDKTTFVRDKDGQSVATNVLAPWRSLIYRNVDTPFTYSDDFAIFPHMPFNTAGYDCRAPRIMGEWMVSIPSRRRTIYIENPVTKALEPVNAEETAEPQPFVEVPPGDAFYKAAASEAEKRLQRYHEGHRYEFCPDTTDIVDPDVEAGKAIVPQDTGYPSAAFPSILAQDGVPDRAHWIVSDSTQVSGDWLPRRSDYADVLLGEDRDKVSELTVDKLAVMNIVGLGSHKSLKPLKLSSEFKDFALHSFPMALWQDKPECKTALSGQPKPSDFTDPAKNPDAARDTLPWLLGLDAPPASSAVYTTSPGAMVFEQICKNCHGPDADGQSTLADTILTMTGGKTRVANLRDGLLGPLGMPGVAREAVFGEKAKSLSISSEDLAGRYLAWMALGGTEKPIPTAALVAVANSKVFGEFREFNEINFPRPPPASGNMLATGRWLCGAWVKSGTGFDIATGQLDRDALKDMPFVQTTGDFAIWNQLCHWDNPGPVRVITSSNVPAEKDFQIVPLSTLVNIVSHSRAAYPTGWRVGGPGGRVDVTLTDSNPTPWCIQKPPLEQQQQNAVQYWTTRSQYADPEMIPWCPTELLGSPTFDDSDVNPAQREWAVRGAANAGLAVYVYLDALARGQKPKVSFDQCEKLLASGN